MIYGLIHKGSGLGNQLFRYVATRTLAEKNGYDFSMINSEGFKGKSFMNLDMGKPNNFSFHIEEPAGKVVVDMPSPEIEIPLWEEKTNYYNPEFNFIEDHTIIDGEFQDERYFDINKIDEWLKVEPIHNLDGESFTEDVCVIGFRGGEFSVFPELFLPKEYWDKGIEMIKNINPKVTFEVHTDDEVLAQQFFPNFKVVHDIGVNWRSIRYAKYAIIANSSFYILPRLLRHNDPIYIETLNERSIGEEIENSPITIAPRYWARHNTKEWSMPQNYYKSFQYI